MDESQKHDIIPWESIIILIKFSIKNVKIKKSDAKEYILYAISFI